MTPHPQVVNCCIWGSIDAINTRLARLLSLDLCLKHQQALGAFLLRVLTVAHVFSTEF
jgi:hypothetical protein